MIDAPPPGGPINGLIRFCLTNKLIVFLLTAFLVVWGVLVAPFAWELEGLPRDPVPVDAIPDTGENQQIIFTDWMGRSPQDIEDQVTYPLTTALLGLPEVKTIRSFSMFGFSSIYVIFDESAEFYWTRSRILEKLNSLPQGTLPEGATPRLGPDATALGQVFWYTLEGRAVPDGGGGDSPTATKTLADQPPAGGWDLQELRSVQDWYVRYALQGVEGVSEVASIGGFVKEYQVDVDPSKLRAFDVTLEEVFNAVRKSNIDVGARTIELNRVEYVIRGLGFLENLDDLRNTLITTRNNVPVMLADVAEIQLGPALRRGVLDKEGAEAVGGVVVTRYGENPLAVIQRVKEKIAEISPGLPRKTLEDGTVSQISIIPFYDRTGLIYETLGTLETAVTQEILITIIVVILLVLNLRSSLLISGVLPLAVLFSFIGMKLFGIDANIVALSGIAIAIGTIVDMGIVMVENVLEHLDAAQKESGRALTRAEGLEVVYRACTEVGSAVLTAVATTVVSFLPVFTMEAAEGKLFQPLAYTKTFALIASIAITLTIIPPLAHMVLTGRPGSSRKWSRVFPAILTIIAGVALPILLPQITWLLGGLLIAIGLVNLVASLKTDAPSRNQSRARLASNILIALGVGVLLADNWAPLGPEHPVANLVFVIFVIGGLLGFFYVFIKAYEPILRWVLNHKIIFLGGVGAVTLFGFTAWLGLGTVFGWMPGAIKNTGLWSGMFHAMPGFSKEFMPSLDEGSYLYMPTTMPHASIGEVMEIIQIQDRAISAIPEVSMAVGKLGRAESPLDPAPISMIETVVNYKTEFVSDANGRILTFETDRETGEFLRDDSGELIPDPRGKPFRQWREEIRSPDDIWQEIVEAAQVPGTTSAPKLQPIAARMVMLQSGMRAPMGLKVFGPDLESIEGVALEIESILQTVPGIKRETVLADRIVGKPYLEIDIDRRAAARYGIKVQDVQDVIEVAIGGKPLTTTVEGRERYPVRVRYQRELRDSIEDIQEILVAAPDGTQIPLQQLAEIRYLRGPQVIKSEDTFLVGYVIFDKHDEFSEVDIVEQARDVLQSRIDSGELAIPAGVSYRFTGSYENQVRAEKKLRLILPISLFTIFLLLYLQFRSVSTSLLVFSGIAVAWAGGFILIWLYGQEWFLNLEIFDRNIRELFQIQTINLSVAVWVGFLALFGIATDDGVIMGTYLQQRFAATPPTTRKAVREATIEAGLRRVRPATMTVATTVLALLPVLTSTGRGSDVMVPMAIPTFGGMLIALVTILVVPTLYCWIKEARLPRD